VNNPDSRTYWQFIPDGPNYEIRSTYNHKDLSACDACGSYYSCDACPSLGLYNVAGVYRWTLIPICPAGQYASSGTCVNCPAGTHSGDSGAISSSTCQPCPAQHYSASGYAGCLPCPSSGHFSAPGAAKCTVDRWFGCDTTSDCAFGTQCRVGDHRCLTLADFQWAEWVDNTQRDGTVMGPLPCTTEWGGCYTTWDCCDQTQCRWGDPRCLSLGAFQYAEWVDNIQRNATVITRCPAAVCAVAPYIPHYGCDC